MSQLATYGAHEMMEMHEVLTDTIDGINQFLLYQPYIQDAELNNIWQRQMQFMSNEYDMMVSTMQQQTTAGAFPTFEAPQNVQPKYGLRSPAPETPNASAQQMNDRDVASGMMGCAKASATMRMHAALECANPTLRELLVQGAENCAEQAYELWNYMNQRGYYQVPTMKEMTTRTMMGTYQPSTSPNMNPGMMQ